MDIVDVLKFLAIEGNLNIVAGKDVTGPVNLLINDVTIADALEIVLSINNLAYQMKGNIIKVTTNKEYKALQGVDFYDQRQTVIYQLKYASAKNLGAMLGNVKSEIGKIIFDDSTGTLVLIDTPAKIKEMEEVIKKSELPTVTRVLPTETRIFELKYAKVDNVKDEITKALTENIGSVRIDSRTNTLVITDLPHQMERIETIIKAFDRQTREVFIEAKIVEVTLGDTFKWGIDWNRLTWTAGKGYSFLTHAQFPLFLATSVEPDAATSSTAGTGGRLQINTLRTNDLDIILDALSTISETKILSNPHLTVEEGKEASIKVIEKQPYEEETTATASGGTTTTSKSYQWVDVGVQLNVTPTINEDGYISMLIKPEVSSISDWYGGTAQAAGAVPVVKSANAETTVTIKDGVTIMIAGLIKDEKTKSVNKVPLLGDIPILGNAFKSISDDIKRTETIVFLTPRIVTGDKSFLLLRDMAKEIKGIRE
jgi:type II secretory pathway component GspD/PulD (secretin)